MRETQITPNGRGRGTTIDYRVVGITLASAVITYASVVITHAADVITTGAAPRDGPFHPPSTIEDKHHGPVSRRRSRNHQLGARIGDLRRSVRIREVH